MWIATLLLLYISSARRPAPLCTRYTIRLNPGNSRSIPKRPNYHAHTSATAGAVNKSVVKTAFHDADTDILARILADTSDTRDILKLFLRQAERRSRPTRRHPRDDPREAVGVGVVECGLCATEAGQTDGVRPDLTGVGRAGGVQLWWRSDSPEGSTRPDPAAATTSPRPRGGTFRGTTVAEAARRAGRRLAPSGSDADNSR